MPAQEPLIYDAWTPMSFKRAMGNQRAKGNGWRAPDWVGHHERRLMAYRILAAYCDNSARVFLGTNNPMAIDKHREYGDAHLIVGSVVAALLGESQEIVVGQADDYDPDNPTTEGDGEDTNSLDAKKAFELQEWLREWADAERLPLKMLETERNAVGLGDGVYTLGWSDEKGRPRCRVFDPGFYFPVLSDSNEDDYPETVHIAWELETGSTDKKKIRRITWELEPIAPAGEPGFIGRVLGADPVPLDGDTLEADGRISRQYPWNDEPSYYTCYLTDATWELDVAASHIEDLSGNAAVYAIDSAGEINRRDLMIDFLPVIHVPNTVSIQNHYGRSTVAAVLQILDDLSNADTDLQAASATTGTPPIALSGATMGGRRVGYGPGEIFEVGDGKMDVLDTSRSLDALIKYVEHLLGRLSVNARVPESVLGRVKPSEVPSGVALALSFGPLASMVAEMRLIRNEKYPLLLKFAHRLALAGGAQDVPADWMPATVEFGSYLPQDQAAAVQIVKNLMTGDNPTISLETAVRILIEAGFPIDDAAEEVRRIERRDFKGADDLLAATNDRNAVFEYLDREKPKGTPVQPPTVLIPPGTQPPVPGQPPVVPPLPTPTP